MPIGRMSNNHSLSHEFVLQGYEAALIRRRTVGYGGLFGGKWKKNANVINCRCHTAGTFHLYWVSRINNNRFFNLETPTSTWPPGWTSIGWKIKFSSKPTVCAVEFKGHDCEEIPMIVITYLVFVTANWQSLMVWAVHQEKQSCVWRDDWNSLDK